MTSSPMQSIRKPFRGNRGQLTQVIFIIILLFTIGLTLLIASKILTGFWTSLDEAAITTAETNQTRVAFDTVPATFDYGMLFVVFGLSIGLMITSFMIPSHPIFIVINFFGIYLLVFLSMTISNLYGEIIAGEDSPFITEAESYPITNFLINYMPYICVIIVFFSTVIMFAKGQGGTYGQ